MYNKLLKLKFLLFIFILALSPIHGHSKHILKVGASSSPHAEILEQTKPILAAKGIELKIIIFQDYIMPNKALSQKSLDANYYQHLAFLEHHNKAFDYNLVTVGKIHFEPMGLYSKKYSSLDNIPNKATVLMSNSLADRARFLNILEEANLIKLKPFKTAPEKANASFNDIISNPKNLKFKYDIQPSLMPKMYLNNAADLIFINANYAISANLNPTKDAIYLENKANTLYTNVLVARKDNVNDPNIQILLETLHSEPIKNFILKKYNGVILPLKENTKNVDTK